MFHLVSDSKDIYDACKRAEFWLEKNANFPHRDGLLSILIDCVYSPMRNVPQISKELNLDKLREKDKVKKINLYIEKSLDFVIEKQGVYCSLAGHIGGSSWSEQEKSEKVYIKAIRKYKNKDALVNYVCKIASSKTCAGYHFIYLCLKVFYKKKEYYKICKVIVQNSELLEIINKGYSIPIKQEINEDLKRIAKENTPSFNN